MSSWIDLWRKFVRETSYMHTLKEKNISNDQFWRSYGIYDQTLIHSGYPGEILTRISSFISRGATLLDVGAGTGAFAIPLSRQTSRTVAVDPSGYQLQILLEKAQKNGLTNITAIEKEWKDVLHSEIFGSNDSGTNAQGIDYSLAAYSLFDEDIENFLTKMIAVTRKGIFIIFCADGPDSLNEFAYGPRPHADYRCIYHILKEMGYQFDVILFSRNYSLPIELVFKQYRFSGKDNEEIADHLKSEGRLWENEDGKWAAFSAKDAMLYMFP
ncbi:MAG: class I SAM-dependent methyltransferase [Methanothrix sp.]|nr:class I SAM-dependent methyltransferase [Methanothrix sp.]